MSKAFDPERNRLSMSFEAAVHAQAIKICRSSLEMTANAGSGHPTTSASISHLVTVLLFHTMQIGRAHV